MKNLKNICIYILAICMGAFLIIVTTLTGYCTVVHTVTEKSITPITLLLFTLFLCFGFATVQWVPMMYKLLKKWHPLFKKQGE